MARKEPLIKEEKPFFWIPLRGKPMTQKFLDHDRFTGWNGRLELEIEVISQYLYLGSGNFIIFNLRDREHACYAFTRRNGQLIIPGTSIKGAVRSVVEAISNSCIGQSASKERVTSSHERDKCCPDVDHLCTACRLFGTPEYSGRACFSDAVPAGRIELMQIKVADLWPPHQSRERKFYQSKSFQQQDMQPQKSHRFLEVVPKGARFITTLSFENATSAEMGILSRAIGFDRSSQDPTKVVCAFPIKMGGAKSRCLGSVHFHPKKLCLLPQEPREHPKNYFSALLAGGVQSPVADILKTWLEDESLLDQWTWERFREEAKLKAESCPREVY